MDINFFAEKTEMPVIDKKNISNWIRKIIESEGKSPGDLNIIFCSDEYLLGINKKYLNHNYFTDIITFNYCEKNKISGDIFISTDRVNDNSEKYNTGSSELLRVIIHGVLHLIGYDDTDESSKKEMTEKENEALKVYEYSDNREWRKT